MILGIDIGGSHITAALIDPETVKMVPASMVRHSINSKGTVSEIIAAWARTIQEVWSANELLSTKIGIAMPGPFDYEQGMSWINTDKYEALYGLNVKEQLAEKLNISNQDIRFINDAAAFLSGEMMGGAGIGYQHAIGVTLGTGLGSSFHHTGITRDAARFDRPLHNGMAEDYISTRFFRRRYQELTGIPDMEARELAAIVATDAAAEKVFREFSENLALFLADFINDEQPEVVVIGGNIANAWTLFYPVLEQVLHQKAASLVIKKAALGEEAALIGGACCWISF